MSQRNITIAIVLAVAALVCLAILLGPTTGGPTGMKHRDAETVCVCVEENCYKYLFIDGSFELGVTFLPDPEGKPIPCEVRQ